MKVLLLYLNHKLLFMKKLALIILLAVATVVAVSSCNKEVCPAYSNSDTCKTGNVG